MYHPGKVIKVFSGKNEDVRSSDNTTQALVEMWDENVLTFLVDPHLPDIKDGEIILVDYTPVSATNPNPKHVIVKILRGKTGDMTWSKYKKYHEKKLKALQPQQGSSGQVMQPEYYG